MRRVPWLFVLTLFVPQAASSLQLHWNSGLTDLTFSEAKCCTLVVQADVAEGRLPPEWRLVWAADSAGVSPVPLPPEASCQQVAEIQSISAPTTPTEIAANIMTARFCSSEGEMATTARFVLDLEGGKKGKFRVIAIDPADTDSERVLTSNTVTFNGGVETPFPPIVLRTSTVHRSTVFHLQAVGSGLAEARGLALVL